MVVWAGVQGRPPAFWKGGMMVQEKAGARQPMLNAEVEAASQANMTASVLFPKTGVLIAGDAGAEFRSRDGRGFIQMPWAAIRRVIVDAYGTFVRSLTFELGEGRSFSFVVSDGAPLVRVLNVHLGREKLVPARHHLKRA